MKVYISGAMTDLPNLNKASFDTASGRLMDMGHIAPTTPFDINTPDADYRAAMANDLDYICSEADGVLMLNGWQRSNGATAEYHTALACGLPIWQMWSDGKIVPWENTDKELADYREP